MSFPRLRVAATALALVLGVGLAAGPALAQTSLDDPLDARDAKRVDRMEKVVRELRSIVFQLKETGKPVVVQPADTDARLQDLANRLGDLEQTLTRINGSLDATSQEVDQARRANADLQAQVKALSDRLTAVEQKAEAAAAPPAPAAQDAPAPQASPTEAFAKARELMLGGDYAGAEGAFAAYVQTYPDAPRAPEARYWWGKTLSVRGAHAQAATAYIGAIRGWPKTTWAPDAVSELARSLVALKKPADACATLSELAKRYPKAPPAVTSRATATARQAKCAA
ncbi:tol-pal system protein YbgF [Phenylobacterium sp. LjRoot225]|uniref:tol-pal system protein YbgF n=1 Tax=Phenylobacterium sp. LjRoot225 TaxID=3342285 RepID=UPI003ECD1848